MSDFRRDARFVLFGLGANGWSWRGLGLLAGVYLGAFLVAAVMAPLVYWGIAAWAEAPPDGPEWLRKLILYLGEKDFPRYFDRLRWIPVLIGVPWLLRTCGLWSLDNLGYRREPGWLRRSALWFGVGVLMLTLVLLTQALAHDPTFRKSPTVASVLTRAVYALAGGLTLGLMEEMVFRGMVFRIFYTAVRPKLAVILSALFFASVHFKKIPWDDAATIYWYSGIEVALWTLLSPFQTFDLVFFLNYFLAGVCLALVFLRTGSLWPAVGLHAGWVFFRSLYDRFIRLPIDDGSLFWGSDKVLDGLFPTLMLAGLAIWLARGLGNESTPAEDF